MNITDFRSARLKLPSKESQTETASEVLTKKYTQKGIEKLFKKINKCQTRQEYEKLIKTKAPEIAETHLFKAASDQFNPLPQYYHRALEKHKFFCAVPLAKNVDLTPYNGKFILKDYKPYPFKIPNIELTFDCRKQGIIVTNRMTMQSTKRDEPLVLKGKTLLLGLKINGVEVKEKFYQVDTENLVITDVPREKPFVLEVISWLFAFALKHNSVGFIKTDKGVYATQCEPDGFRKITFHPDRPDILSIFTTKVFTEAKHRNVLAGGDLVERKVLSDGRVFTHYTDPFLKPSYLFALVFGNIACVKSHVTTPSKNRINIEIYVPPGKEKFTKAALAAIKHAIIWDETHFGRIYEHKVLRLVCANIPSAAAMENTGCIVFNQEYLVWDPDTDTDENLRELILTIIHEYMHHRFGNRATVRDWSQVGLKEGMATFLEYLCAQAMPGGDHTRAHLYALGYYKYLQWLEKSSHAAPIRLAEWNDPDDHNQLYVYNKAAEVFRMLRTLLGDPLWKRGISDFSKTYDGQGATIDNFLDAMERNYGRSLTQFKQWFDKSGMPEIATKLEYDPNANEAKLTFKQKCEEKDGTPWNAHIPIRVAFFDDKGTRLTLCQQGEPAFYGKTEYVVELTGAEQTFIFKNIPSKPIPSFFRDCLGGVCVNTYSKGLAKMGYPYSFEELMVLVEFDDDPIVRFEAAQRLIRQEVTRLAYNSRAKVSDEIITLFGKLIADKKLDAGMLSKLMYLPSNINILTGELISDPDLKKGIERFGEQVSQIFIEEFIEIVEKLVDTKEKPFTLKAHGERELVTVCCHYLSYAGDDYKLFFKEVALKAQTGVMQLAIISALRDKEARLPIIDEIIKAKPSSDPKKDEWRKEYLSKVQLNDFDEMKYPSILKWGPARKLAYKKYNPKLIESILKTFDRHE